MGVTIEHLTKVYDGKIVGVQDVSLQLEAGVLGLLGPNGAGKTTLMRILATLLDPTSGTARVEGYDVRRQRPEVRRILGYLPQQFGLYPQMTCREFLDYIGLLYGMSRAERREAVEQTLQQVHLEELASRRIRALSGGMKQRLGLAQAVLAPARLLIVDKPTAGLDPEERIRVRNLLGELGQVSLNFTTSEVWPGTRTYWEWEPATGRGPSVANPDNAAINAKLRGKAPFNEIVSLRPEPSCPPEKDLGPDHVEPWLGSVLSNRDLSRACATSADALEAVHRATGLPIVADFYTHLLPVGKLTVDHGTLFHALCQVGDAMGLRWTMDGPFLLCRSTGYFWDKLKEVPNRCLQRWARDRDASGGLPFADFLEMAAMTDEQLDSSVVADGIDRLWKLPEWAILNYRPTRHTARYLASLTPEQLQRALQPDGLPFPSLGPSQQQGAIKMQFEALAEMEREGGGPTPIPEEMWSHAFVGAKYIPAGWYAWAPQPDDIYGPPPPIGGRTAAEALAAVRRVYPPARAQDITYYRTAGSAAASRSSPVTNERTTGLNRG